MKAVPNIITVLIWLVGGGLVFAAHSLGLPPPALVGIALVVVIASVSPQIAKQWERAIVLRLGRFQRTAGPGLFFVIPFVETVTAIIDQRVITTSFRAEETLTR